MKDSIDKWFDVDKASYEYAERHSSDTTMCIERKHGKVLDFHAELQEAYRTGVHDFLNNVWHPATEIPSYRDGEFVYIKRMRDGSKRFIDGINYIDSDKFRKHVIA